MHSTKRPIQQPQLPTANLAQKQRDVELGQARALLVFGRGARVAPLGKRPERRA